MVNAKTFSNNGQPTNSSSPSPGLDPFAQRNHEAVLQFIYAPQSANTMACAPPAGACHCRR